MKTRKPALTALVLLLFLPAAASAHIKWFAEYDVADAPRALAEVLDSRFWLLLLAASLALLVTYAIDSRWTRAARCDWLKRRFADQPDLATSMVRIGTGVFFVALWLVGGVILTPELETDWGFISGLHLAIALFTLFDATLILSGVGILILYAYGIVQYGLFHMLDYAIFPGLAVYLALSSIGGPGLKRHRLPILALSLLFSFLWSAIEKLAYPQWFDGFLDAHGFLTMGLPRDIFLMCAAFVELTLIYVLLTARNLAVVAAVVLNLLIVAGAVYFGRVDTIGHFPFIFVLAIMAIEGQCVYPLPLFRDGRGTLDRAGILVLGLGYWLCVALMFSFYYGTHWLIYGGGSL